MQITDSLEKTLIRVRIKAGGEENNREWDGCVASLTQWTWVWASSRSWWWTGRPGVLQSWGRPELDMNERLNCTETHMPGRGAQETVVGAGTPQVAKVSSWVNPHSGDAAAHLQNSFTPKRAIEKATPKKDPFFSAWFLIFGCMLSHSMPICCGYPNNSFYAEKAQFMKHHCTVTS